MPFPVEKAPTRKISSVKGLSENEVKIYVLSDYPVRGIVFEGGNALEDLADVVSTACICLQNNNIPYNVLISDSGKRIFLFPQVTVILPVQFMVPGEQNKTCLAHYFLF